MRALKLGVCLLVIASVMWLGGEWTRTSVESWYPTLQKPFFNPPKWVFPVVWPILYIMMAISFWLVWIKPAKRSFSYILFGWQLLLNLLWSYWFFKLQDPGYALLDIVLLWGVLLATVGAFFEESKLAGWLLVPYFLWVSFAVILNFEIWRLN
ncbi:MAG: tryptophan-rich sensory protein [Chlamydiia bacterium]|nr:tryptophan-rich sensory protein [Chlamydiia bacterium]